VKVLLKGKEYVGEYDVDGTTLRVFFEGKSRTGQIRGSDPALLARLLLIELLNECDRKQQLSQLHNLRIASYKS
jgi:hypothetical protein